MVVTKWLQGAILVVTLCIGIVSSTEDTAGHYLNQFAIQLNSGGREVAESIARDHGFIVKRELPNIKAYLLEHPNVNHRSKRSADNELQFLKNDNRIKHAQQEVVLKRVKRSIVYDKQLELPIRTVEDDSLFARYETPSVSLRDDIYGVSMSFSDPKFKDMWYLSNQGQSGGEKGMDLNVEVAWANGFTGKGVVVCILDDGVDHTHPDLAENYDPEASTDLNDKSDRSDDPMPDLSNDDNSHGTRCAGEIAAAANNDVCGVGIAYEARIGGIRILDGAVTDALEAEAITFNNNYIDIYSASWGPNDDGATMEGPRHLTLQALKDGVLNGRKGLGSIFVWATGNGGMNEDDCSADGYVSRPETLSVGSVNDWGRSPFFMENCSSTLAVVPSGGEDYMGQEDEDGKIKLKVVTTDVSGGCIENFQGTSSAAPLAAGCMATVLQANPRLTWRDVQHIVIHGTRVPSADSSWTINGAGFHISHRFGFGLMDCGRMVELAQTWSPVSEQLMCNTTRTNYQIIHKNGQITDTMVISSCGDEQKNMIDRLEHVQVHVKMSTKRRGQTVIALISPAGTRSVLLSPRSKDEHKGDWEFTFMTVHSWGESPVGKWELEVSHLSSGDEEEGDNSIWETLIDSTKMENGDLVGYDSKSPFGYISEWSLALYGTHGARHDRTDINKDRKQKAYYPSTEDVSKIKKREFELSQQVQVKRADIGQAKGTDKKNLSTGTSEKKQSDALLQRLWDLLHKNGGREVRKRVLGSSSSPEKVSEKNRMSEIDKLTDEVTRLLENRLKQREAKEDEMEDRFKKKQVENASKRSQYLKRLERVLDELEL